MEFLAHLLLLYTQSKSLKDFFEETQRDGLKDYYNLTDEEFDTIFIKED